MGKWKGHAFGITRMPRRSLWHVRRHRIFVLNCQVSVEMSIQELGSIGELIAAIATVATLIYLAIQINQNTRAAKASVLEATGSRSSDLAKFVADSPELSRIVMTAMTTNTELEEVDRFRLQLLFTAAMRSYEITVAHRATNFLDPTQYSGLRNNISGWVATSYFAARWENAQENFSSELRALVTEEMKNPPAYPNFLIAPQNAQSNQ